MNINIIKDKDEEKSVIPDDISNIEDNISLQSSDYSEAEVIKSEEDSSKSEV